MDGRPKKRIGAAVQSTLSGLANVASDATRTCTKEQECLKVYRYFPQKLWAVCKSGEALKNKFRHVAHFIVDVMRLRNPNAQTKRLIVSSIFAASSIDREPTDAYNDIQDFGTVMKQVRESIKTPHV